MDAAVVPCGDEPEASDTDVRPIATGTRRRGGWAIVVIAVLLAASAATMLLWRTQPTTEPAGPAGRVEVAAEQTSQIWTLKAEQAPFLASQGAGEISPTRGGDSFEVAPVTSGTSADWAIKAEYGRARQAAFGGSAR